MKGYLLDTNICIYLFKGKYNLMDKILEVGMENCYISEITLTELIYGAVCSSDEKRHTQEVVELLKIIKVLPIRPVNHTFAVIKKTLRMEGKLIDNFDLLIGATALDNNLVMVTENVRHFAHIGSLSIEDWTSGRKY